MKITGIERHEIHPPLRAWNRDAHRLNGGDLWDTRTILVVHTDNGLEGLAEHTGPGDPDFERNLEKLRGTDPCAWLAHPELDIRVAPAIYDLVGKANGVPAYRLFGPKVRSWVPFSSWTVSQTPALMAEEVKHAAAQGYLWMKYHTHSFHNVIDQTRAMQEAAPRGFRIHYDLNWNNPVEHAVELSRELSRFPIAGLIEDPLRTFDLEGYKVLRQKSSLPVAIHHMPLGGREALMGLADGYMLGHAPVGVAIRRAGLFEAANSPFMMQNTGGNITRALVLHMAAAFEQATLHHVTLAHLWEDDVVDPFEVVAGQVEVPEEPGLGVTLNREALERLKSTEPPPIPRALIRVSVENGPTAYGRAPMRGSSSLDPTVVPGVGDGYDRLVDQDFWLDDGSEDFNQLWKETADRAVFR